MYTHIDDIGLKLRILFLIKTINQKPITIVSSNFWVISFKITFASVILHYLHLFRLYYSYLYISIMLHFILMR